MTSSLARPGRPAAADGLTPNAVVTTVAVLLSGYAATIGVRIGAAGLVLPTALFLGACLVALLGTTRETLAGLRVSGLDVVAATYVVVRLATELIDAYRLDHAPDIGTAGNTTYYAVAYVLVRVTITDLASLRRFLGIMAAPAPVVAAIGVLQAVSQSTVTRWVIRYTHSDAAAARIEDGRLTRATSTIGHWSALGGYLCCVIAICGVCALLDREAGRTSRWPLLVGAACVAGVVSTFTVSVAVIAVGLVLTVFACFRRTGLGIGFIGVASIVSLAVFRQSIASRIAVQSVERSGATLGPDWLPATLAVRLPLWAYEGIPAWLEQPVTGWGHSVYGATDWPDVPLTIVWPYPESEYVKALVCGGIVELVVLVVLLAMWFRTFAVARRVVGVEMSWVLVALVLGLVVGGVVNPFFTSQGVPSILWPLAGAFVWCGQRREPS